ncbi:hypothetical protein [Pelagibacterium sp.]|uniref:hypothetical protein n=1 Tax=Pelagibacterium sp. TaxID=1967288 RepID=UPI003A90F691
MAYSIYKLISTHASAVARLENASDRIDDIRAVAEGRIISPEDEAEWESAELAEGKAFDAILSLVPAGTVEHHRKLDYIGMHTRYTETLDSRQLKLLFDAHMQVRLRESA